MAASAQAWGVCSDVGKVRVLNEDYATAQAVDDRSEGQRPALLAAVADGMGGHSAGEVASKLATEVVMVALAAALSRGGVTEADLVSAMQGAFTSANRTVHEQAKANPEQGNMGTTLTAVIFRAGSLVVGHVGDSRAYLVHRGRAQKLTRDQTLVQRKVDLGVLTEREATRSDERNQLLQAVGPDPQVEGQFFSRHLQPHDVVLLATDGAYASLAGDDLVHAVQTNGSAQAVCDDLVLRARVRDGSDNLTMVCLAPDGVRGERCAEGLTVGAGRINSRLILQAALGAVLVLIAVVGAQIVRSSWPSRRKSAPPAARLATPGTTDGSLDLDLRLEGSRLVARYRGGVLLWLGIDGSSPERLAPTAAGASDASTATVSLSPRRGSPPEQSVVLRIVPGSSGKARWSFTRYPDPGSERLPESLRCLRLDGVLVSPSSHKPVPRGDPWPQGGIASCGTSRWPVGRLQFGLAGNGGEGLPVVLAFGATRSDVPADKSQGNVPRDAAAEGQGTGAGQGAGQQPEGHSHNQQRPNHRRSGQTR